MSKKKSKHKITQTDTQRFILRDGEKLHLTNETGVALLVTAFPAVLPKFNDY